MFKHWRFLGLWDVLNSFSLLWCNFFAEHLAIYNDFFRCTFLDFELKSCAWNAKIKRQSIPPSQRCEQALKYLFFLVSNSISALRLNSCMCVLAFVSVRIRVLLFVEHELNILIEIHFANDFIFGMKLSRSKFKAQY